MILGFIWEFLFHFIVKTSLLLETRRDDNSILVQNNSVWYKAPVAIANLNLSYSVSREVNDLWNDSSHLLTYPFNNWTVTFHTEMWRFISSAYSNIPLIHALKQT